MAVEHPGWGPDRLRPIRIGNRVKVHYAPLLRRTDLDGFVFFIVRGNLLELTNGSIRT